MSTDDLATGSAPDEGGWKFDASVTAAFEDMLERSIPQYEVMRRAVSDAAVWVAERAIDEGYDPQPRIVDLGTSRGSALAPIVDRLGNRARYFGYEISEPMIAVAQERFAREIADGLVEIHRHDLRDGFPPRQLTATIILSVLTIQFVPIEHRQRILRGIRNRLTASGAFIWVEKVLGATADLDSLEVDTYYGLKRGNGYTQEAIDRKRLSLEGVLVPLTASFNEELLRGAGFEQIDCVWAWMNFRCWVAMR